MPNHYNSRAAAVEVDLYGEPDVGQGTLNAFFNNTGPLNATIKASCPSPDKTASTLSWSASPNSVVSSSRSNNHSSSNNNNNNINDVILPGDEEEHSVTSYFKRHQKANNDTLLRVQVEASSSQQKTTFYVPVSLMLQREMEMQQAAAKHTNMNKERWSSSRLFSLWKSAKTKTSTNANSNTNKSTAEEEEEEITLRLSPETSMKDYSTLQWQPWLTTCIRAYYNTGTIRIPDDCLGSDILFALEYFGILTTSPDTFVFDSYPAYDRIKCWSGYLTHRNTIAEWILNDYRARGGGYSRVWTASCDPVDMVPSTTLLQINGETASVLVGGVTEKNHQSCKMVNDIFNDKESGNRLTDEAPGRMRLDFCEHMQRSLSRNLMVRFQMEQVKITTSTGRIAMEMRPVFRIRIGELQQSSILRQPQSQPQASSSSSLPPRGSSSNHSSKQQQSQMQSKSQPFDPTNNSHQSTGNSKKSSGSPIGNVIGFQAGGPEMMSQNLRQTGEEADFAATQSVEVSIAGASRQPILHDVGRSTGSGNGGGCAASLGSSVTDAFGEVQKRSSSYPYGDECELDAPIVMHNRKPSISTSVAVSGSGSGGVSRSLFHESHTPLSSVEQRHPQRSSPPPDGKRSSPENVHHHKYTMSADADVSAPAQRNQTISDKEFMQEIEAVAPVRFVITSFGDLRSVTSGLSGADEASTIADIRINSKANLARYTALQQKEENKIEEGPERLTPKSESTKSASFVEDEPKYAATRNTRTREPEVDETGAPAKSWGYWESVLASICEAVVPGPEQNNRSRSPVRHVEMPLVEDGARVRKKGGRSDNARAEGKHPSIRGTTEEWLLANLTGPEYETEEDTSTDNKNIPESPPRNDSVFLDSAKIMGNRLSAQLEEFLKLTVDAPETLSKQMHTEESKLPDKLPMPRKARPPLRRSRSAKSREENSEEEVATLRRSRSSKSREEGSPRDSATLKKSRSSKSREERDNKKHSKTKEMSGLGNPSRGSAFTPTKTRSMGASEVRYQPEGSEFQLPPREPRRTQGRAGRAQVSGIARKKKQSSSSAQVIPPRHPTSSFSGVPSNPSHASSRTLSTAKVKNSKQNDGDGSQKKSRSFLRRK